MSSMNMNRRGRASRRERERDVGKEEGERGEREGDRGREREREGGRERERGRV